MICRIRGSYGGMVTFIIILILVGLVAGAVARLVVPGRDPIGILGTIVLGIVGSFVGGFITSSTWPALSARSSARSWY